MAPQISFQDTIRSIFNLFEAKGSVYYEESVTQLEHALQSANYAHDISDNDYIIIGALLHDIGHLLSDDQDTNPYGRIDHEIAGSTYLERLGFPPVICDIVKYHVTAKRYLVTKDVLYYDSLSAASKHTLRLQGGDLNELELEEFEALLYFDEIVTVRICDDRAKEISAQTKPLDHYFEKAVKILSS